MTEQKQQLIEKFDKWLDTNPRKQIIAAECANIAEEYADEQLKLYGVGKSFYCFDKAIGQIECCKQCEDCKNAKL